MQKAEKSNFFTLKILRVGDKIRIYSVAEQSAGERLSGKEEFPFFHGSLFYENSG